MEDKSLEVKKAVYIRPNPTCPTCMKVLPYQVNIDSIESQDVGWVLHGVGKHKTSKVLCRCPNCGAMYQTLLYAIPIECASFPFLSAAHQRKSGRRPTAVLQRERKKDRSVDGAPPQNEEQPTSLGGLRPRRRPSRW